MKISARSVGHLAPFATTILAAFIILSSAAAKIASSSPSEPIETMLISNDEDLINEEEDDDLIHIPLRSRESVLRERNLLHLLQEEMEEDVDATFARWARSYTPDSNNSNNNSLLRNTNDRVVVDIFNDKNNNNENGNRHLQEISGDGTHFIDAWIGTPAQKRVLAVSSGADFTAFPCQGCTECGRVIEPYEQARSDSFTSMPCGRCVGGQRDDVCDRNREKCVARGYNLVDKSAWTAYEARDYIYVGGANEEMERLGLQQADGTDVPKRFGFPLVFACQTEALGWYSSQVKDGIMGFSTARTSFVNQMVFQDKLKYPRFCMCFENRMRQGMDMRGAGVVTLGGYNPKILDAPLVFVQNIAKQGETRYKIHVRNIYFRQGGGQSIVQERDGQSVVKLNFDEDLFNAKNGGTILDSGVPLLIFDESIHDTFMAEWEKLTGQKFSFGKMMLTEEEVESLPTIIIQIAAHEGVDKSFNPRTVPNMAGDRDPKHPFDGLLAIPSSHYMEYNPSTSTYRAKISLDSKLGSFLGINAMQGHAFFYDLAKDRIGFAESYNCRPKMSPAGDVDDDMFEMPSVHIETTTQVVEDGPFGTIPFAGGPKVNPRDDLPKDVGMGPIEDAYHGTCITATCISFVTVGYCIVIAALAVAYKKYRPRDRSKQLDKEDSGEDIYDDDQTEVLNPSFEQHVRYSNARGFA
ncbi:hypothetical protein ACHAWT_006723 [Skeletonema menzelii]